MTTMDQASARQSYLLEQLAGNPGRLLNVVIVKLRLKSDRALACTLGIKSRIIWSIRNGKQPMSHAMLEARQLHIRELHPLVQLRFSWEIPTGAGAQDLPQAAAGSRISPISKGPNSCCSVS